MRKLPSIEKQTIVATINGVELTFRKPTLEDFTEIANLEEEGVSYITKAIDILALLLDGYEETFDQRKIFIRAIPVDSIQGFKKDVFNILEKVGLKQDLKKNKVK